MSIVANRFASAPDDLMVPEEKPDPVKRGKVFTFYSFKGGVGRSMAMANIAVLVAAAGKKVLMVDFDLEAPGLEHFFLPHDGDLAKTLSGTSGVIDLLQPEPADWRQCIANVRIDDKTMAALAGKDGYQPQATRLDIMHSGKASRPHEKYAAQVQALDWTRLYKEIGIGTRFAELRAEWIEDYDFVFVDSRTGVTDIGDLCTVVLPDRLVMLFVTNHQNINGIGDMYDRVLEEHAEQPIPQRDKLKVLPVLSRDEFYSEDTLSREWRKKAADRLRPLFRDWLPESLDPLQAMQKIFVPYFAIWSFGEALPVVTNPEDIANPSRINAAYSRIKHLILDDLDWSILDAMADPGEAASARVAQREELDRERDKLLFEMEQERRTMLEEAYAREAERQREQEELADRLRVEMAEKDAERHRAEEEQARLMQAAEDRYEKRIQALIEQDAAQGEKFQEALSRSNDALELETKARSSRSKINNVLLLGAAGIAAFLTYRGFQTESDAALAIDAANQARLQAEERATNAEDRAAAAEREVTLQRELAEKFDADLRKSLADYDRIAQQLEAANASLEQLRADQTAAAEVMAELRSARKFAEEELDRVAKQLETASTQRQGIIDQVTEARAALQRVQGELDTIQSSLTSLKLPSAWPAFGTVEKALRSAKSATDTFVGRLEAIEKSQ
ncbi:MAG: AAA family ATPase [Pseudomonadota bacterium]